MNDKTRPRVLLISDAAWTDTNNIGNTFSNLFGDWGAENLAMIYARPDMPESRVCGRYFQISENRLMRHFIDKHVKTGQEIDLEKVETESPALKAEEENGKKMYGFFKRHRWSVFLTARNMLWKFGNWKTPELDRFIESFDPDVVFMLACEDSYMNNLQQHVVKKSGKRAAIYFVDDIYSKRRLSASPFYWLHRKTSRAGIRKTVSVCDKVYTIIDKQKEEYDSCFNVESEVINKGGLFSGEPGLKDSKPPLKLVYTGNIFAGRWETLARIGKALDSINGKEAHAKLYIYTQNPLEPEMKKEFLKCRSIEFMGPIPSADVKSVQTDADILVHVESFNREDKMATRLSFSTKLVDYFERARCILAIGWEEAASIDYLVKEKSAVVVTDFSDLDYELRKLVMNPYLIRDFGKKGWDCGKRNHRIEDIRHRLYSELLRLSE